MSAVVDEPEVIAKVFLQLHLHGNDHFAPKIGNTEAYAEVVGKIVFKRVPITFLWKIYQKACSRKHSLPKKRFKDMIRRRVTDLNFLKYPNLTVTDPAYKVLVGAHFMHSNERKPVGSQVNVFYMKMYNRCAFTYSTTEINSNETYKKYIDDQKLFEIDESDLMKIYDQITMRTTHPEGIKRKRMRDSASELKFIELYPKKAKNNNINSSLIEIPKKKIQGVKDAVSLIHSKGTSLPKWKLTLTTFGKCTDENDHPFEVDAECSKRDRKIWFFRTENTKVGELEGMGGIGRGNFAVAIKVPKCYDYDSKEVIQPSGFKRVLEYSSPVHIYEWEFDRTTESSNQTSTSNSLGGSLNMQL